MIMPQKREKDVQAHRTGSEWGYVSRLLWSCDSWKPAAHGGVYDRGGDAALRRHTQILASLAEAYVIPPK